MMLAAALRLYQLGAEGLWFDEANTAVLATLPISELVERISVDNQAPLYFLLVKAATALLGHAEWAVRSVSAAAGVALVWLAHDVGRRLLSRNAARWAAVLAATSPMAIHYSQEARPYALLMVLVLAGFSIGWRFDVQPTTVSALGLVAVCLATALTHNIGPLYVAALAVTFLSSRRPDARRVRMWCAVVAATAAGYLVWLPNVLQQTAGMAHSFAWAAGIWDSEFPWQIPRTWAALTHGSLAPIRNRVPDIVSPAWIALGLSALLWVAGGLRRSNFADPRAPILLSIFAVTPLIGMWLYSALAAAPIYLVGRVDSPALPVYLLLTATGSAALGWRWQWLGVAALVGLAILPLRVHWGIDFKSQERTIARVLDAHRVPDEPVITTAFDCSLIYYSGLQHGDTLLLYPSATEPYLGWVDWGGYDRASLERDAAEVAQRAVARASRTDSSRVWLLLHPDPRYAAIAAALDTMMAPAGEFDFGHLGMTLKVYEPIEPSHD
jgi:4-amino-4-deoxy-L-arabinose transferase-like glycosyltransferase